MRTQKAQTEMQKEFKIIKCVNEFLIFGLLTEIWQIPQHLLENIPRPREVVFTLTVGQLVSASTFASYDVDLVEGNAICYLGRCANARAPRAI